MRHALRLFTILVLLAPGGARAGGLNFAWDQCYPEGGTYFKCFACDTDLGYHSVVGSFAVSDSLPDFIGLGALVDGISTSAELPAWWQVFNAGSCRQAGLSVSFDFYERPQTSCRDPWGAVAIGGISSYRTALFPPPAPLNVPAADAFRLKLAGQLAEPVALAPGVEYYAFELRVRNVKSTGASACAGCGTGVCLLLGEIRVSRASGAYGEVITTPLENMVVTWQSASYAWGCPGGAICDASARCPVPARGHTWGTIKALYR